MTKASSRSRREFLPPGYLSLADAVAIIGEAMFSDTWTGEEITSPSRRHIAAYKDDEYRKAKLERRRELFREQTGSNWHFSVKGAELPELMDEDIAAVERLVAERWAPIEEARQRLTEATGWLQEKLWSEVLPAHVFTPEGKFHPLPKELWGSNDAPAIFETGKVKFHPAKYGWEWNPTAAPLSGRVIILHESLQAALSAEDDAASAHLDESVHTLPFLAFMERAAQALRLKEGIRVPKETIVEWLRNNWPAALEKPTDRKIESMATFLRHPKDQRGGYFKPERDT